MAQKPNLVFVFADQWRAQATGYAGDPNVLTPNLDKLAQESVNFTTAVSCCPICSPYRASLLTGQYPLTHGVFVNDVYLRHNAVSLADVFNEAGYDTAYIGKWHLDGHGRSAFIPKERRQGFQFWKTRECTHDYYNSFYYGDTEEKIYWEGYDAAAQTRAAQQYIKERSRGKPFALVLSWGPPHNPCETAPPEYKALYRPETIKLRANVPAEFAAAAQKELAGYYGHISALDNLVGALLQTLDECGLAEDTIFVFTSDHGDMLWSQGLQRKQQPYDESILVPLLLRYPAGLGRKGRTIKTPINSPDLMPTLLGLCGLPIPETVEGLDYSPYLRGEAALNVEAALIASYHFFGTVGREFRGIRTERYTFVRDHNGPWLFYDNIQDPYQLNNLCNKKEYQEEQHKLDCLLQQILKAQRDEFLPGSYYLNKWGYTVDETGAVPYTP